MGTGEVDELDLDGVEIMYDIGTRISEFSINEEYILMAVISVTIWELSINGMLEPSRTVESELRKYN
jgi:hypothetical protein